MGKTYAQFKAETYGKSYDVDKSYGAQCWDYVSGIYFPWIGGKVIHCYQSGYVKDIANQRNTNGILDFCIDVGLQTELEPGDICIWTNCPACPWSHIAIYDHDNGQNAVFFIGQNQPQKYVTIAKISVSGIIGVFRPKIFVEQEEDKDDGLIPTKDQLLYYGSKVVSGEFKVEAIRGNNIYSRIIGGWIPAEDVDEVDASDGKNDQYLHVGSMVKFNKGVMTVTGFAANNVVSLKELSYLIKADVLIEVE